VVLFVDEELFFLCVFGVVVWVCFVCDDVYKEGWVEWCVGVDFDFVL